MDLDQLYGFDDKKANDSGIWIEIGDAAFNCRHYYVGSPRVAKVARSRSKKYRRLIDAELLSPEQDRQLAIEIFCESSLIGWRGVIIKGEEIPYSFDAAVKLFSDYPALYNDVAKEATDIKRFRDDEEDAKN